MKMKKLLIILTVLFCASVFAQKPEAGKITTEVGLTLTAWNSNINSFGLNGRYFLNPALAFTIGVGMNNYNNTITFAEKPDGSGATGNYETTGGSRNLTLGLQKHFTGTEKLSPWFGLSIGFGGGSSIINGSETNGQVYIKNYSINERGNTSDLNINLNLGMDYWLAEALFIGVQYSPLAFASEASNERLRTVVNNGVTTSTVTNGIKTTQLSTFNAIPTLRLGWRF
jgi:hypothetical protein